MITRESKKSRLDLHPLAAVVLIMVFATSALGTKFIRDDETGGDATSIGNWDWPTKTCTLTTNVTETIQIDSDGITLDGDGYTVNGLGSGYGVYLNGRTGITIENLNVQGFAYGIYLNYSDNNILTGNTANSNLGSGILLWDSINNTLTGNTVSNNGYGIKLYWSSENQIYNNNFIDNTTQARVFVGSGNVFNLDKPIGGNYWSDWTGPDADGDGFVDYPYIIFTGGPDNLPWARENGWALTPQEAIEQLILQVIDLDFQQGIENSLNAKLDAAFKALDDVNANNDVAAINALQAFINAVEAQRGNKISDADADVLIAAANEIIAMLSSP